MVTLELDMIADWSVEHYGDSSYVLGLLLDHSLGMPNVAPHVLGRSFSSLSAVTEVTPHVIIAHGPLDSNALQASYEATKRSIEHWPRTHLHVLNRWWATSLYRPQWVPEWTDELPQWYKKMHAWVLELYEKNNGFPLKPPYLPADRVPTGNSYGGR